MEEEYIVPEKSTFRFTYWAGDLLGDQEVEIEARNLLEADDIFDNSIGSKVSRIIV